MRDLHEEGNSLLFLVMKCKHNINKKVRNGQCMDINSFQSWNEILKKLWTEIGDYISLFLINSFQNWNGI